MREWVRRSMIVEPSKLLWQHKDRVTRHVLLDPSGGIQLVPKEAQSAKGKVVAYFVGKQYAVAGELSQESSVENQELETKLNLPKGTIGRVVKELRDAHLIQALAEGRHVLPITNLLQALTLLEEKG